MDPDAPSFDPLPGQTMSGAGLPPLHDVDASQAQVLYDVFRSEQLLIQVLAGASPGQALPRTVLRLPRPPEGVWVQWLTVARRATRRETDPLLVWGRGVRRLPTRSIAVGVGPGASHAGIGQFFQTLDTTVELGAAPVLCSFDAGAVPLATGDPIPPNMVLVCERDPAGQIRGSSLATAVVDAGGSVVWPSVPRGTPDRQRRREARRLQVALASTVVLVEPSHHTIQGRDTLWAALSAPVEVAAPCPNPVALTAAVTTHRSLTGDLRLVSTLSEVAAHRRVRVVDVPQDASWKATLERLLSM